MHSQFIETNGVKLHMLTDRPENGTPVVLLHGFPEIHDCERNQFSAVMGGGRGAWGLHELSK